jgi:hypothetical protein
VPEAIGYDVIAGDLASVRVENNVLNLGHVRVLARSTTETSLTEPDGATDPPVGHAYFYLIQQRRALGAAGYGTGSAPLPRVPASCDGGCPAAP